MTDIQEFSKNFVNQMFKKITDARWSLMRMTFIQADYCYVCEKPDLTTKEVQIDNIMGRNRHGWICCDNCEKYVRVAKIMEEMAMPTLPFSITHDLTTKNIYFWRKSSNKDISPYVQTVARIDDDSSNSIEWKNKYNTACVVVSWPSSLNVNPNQTQYVSDLNYIPWLSKSIPISNVIFHNRNLFGFDSSCIINKTIKNSHLANNKVWFNKWKKRFDEHYLHANGWLEFYKVCVHKNIPESIIKNILLAWGMFQVEGYYHY
jgi:hypothetical protein